MINLLFPSFLLALPPVYVHTMISLSKLRLLAPWVQNTEVRMLAKLPSVVC